jgi:hypothetical protein
MATSEKIEAQMEVPILRNEIAFIVGGKSIPEKHGHCSSIMLTRRKGKLNGRFAGVALFTLDASRQNSAGMSATIVHQATDFNGSRDVKDGREAGE